MQDMITLIEPLIPGLRRYARALLRDVNAADDLVQDCLERAIGRWHQRRTDGNTRAWMYTILHNLAINHLRRNDARPAQLPIEDAGETALSRPASQEDKLHHHDILDAIGRLPTEQRAVLLLVGVEDLSYSEVAHALDLPIGTVMSRLSRARERLRRDLAGEAKPSSPRLRRIK